MRGDRGRTFKKKPAKKGRRDRRLSSSVLTRRGFGAAVFAAGAMAGACPLESAGLASHVSMKEASYYENADREGD